MTQPQERVRCTKCGDVYLVRADGNAMCCGEPMPKYVAPGTPFSNANQRMPAERKAIRKAAMETAKVVFEANGPDLQFQFSEEAIAAQSHGLTGEKIVREMGGFTEPVRVPGNGKAAEALDALASAPPIVSTSFTITPPSPYQLATEFARRLVQVRELRAAGIISETDAATLAAKAREESEAVPLPGIDYEPLTPPHPTNCAHHGLRHSAHGSDTIECPTCGVFFTGQAIRRIGVLPYDRERTRLADAAGTLRTERDELLRENATLRRKVERLERKR